MAPKHPNYVLDTSIVLAVIRGKKLGDYIEHHYKIQSNPFRPFISIVTLAELHVLARRNNWGRGRYELLEKLEQELVVVDISRNEIVRAYAEIATAKPRGNTLGQNDLWIAATAKVLDATLLTTDKDFDCLHPAQIDRIWIDPAEGR